MLRKLDIDVMHVVQIVERALKIFAVEMTLKHDPRMHMQCDEGQAHLESGRLVMAMLRPYALLVLMTHALIVIVNSAQKRRNTQGWRSIQYRR